jgi:Protein of unknown function (DUF3486)
MPPRSKVAMLPPVVRDELERRMVERGFSGYEELASWLQQQGYQIAEDSVHRYGAKFYQKIESLKDSTLQAMAITHAASADRDSIVDVTLDLLNQRVFSTLLEAEQIEQGDIIRLSRTVSELSRTSIARQRWAQEMDSLLVVDRAKQAARERRAKAAGAKAFAMVRKALLASNTGRPGDASATASDFSVSSAAESPASDLGQSASGKPQGPGK